MEVYQLLDKITFNYMGRRPRLNKLLYSEWLYKLLLGHKKSLGSLNYTYCTDDELLDINRTYLSHDYYTDIITFDLSEEKGLIEGDIYISIDRVKDNAKLNSVLFETELKRVMAHGLLHLIGFKDKSTKEISDMREAENQALWLWEKSMFHVKPH